MTSFAQQRFVAVGIDGSPEALTAARYAVQKAAERGLDVLLAHAYQPPSGASAPSGAEILAYAEAAEAVVTSVAAQLVVPPTMRIQWRLAVGSAARLLLDIEDGADMMVIGHQCILAGAEPPVGSLVNRLAAHGRCPVVTVPRVWRASRDRRPVVVAIDGQSPAASALGYAFNEAARTGTELAVVHAVPENAPVQDDSSAEANLAEVLSSWKADYPDVAVRTQLSRQEPRQLIIDSSRAASVVIVGHPHRLERLPHWYWSMARSVLEASHCPLVVVPALADLARERQRIAPTVGQAPFDDRS